MAKSPADGRAKTRIAEAFGADAAASLARAMLDDTLDVVRAARLDARLLAVDGTPVDAEGFVRCAQPDGDLGLRQADALARALACAPHAIVLGTDAVGFGAAALDAALDALDAADACVVPSRDGGFVALAVRGLPARLLEGLPWSTTETRAALAARFRRAGLRLVEAPMESDVDTVDDLLGVAATTDAARVRPRLLAAARALAATHRAPST